MSGDLIRLRNRSKLVEESLFAIIDLLLGANSITLYFVACGDDFHKNSQIENKKFFFLYYI